MLRRHLIRIRPCLAVLAFWPLHSLSGHQSTERFVVETGVSCHVSPNTASDLSFAIPLGGAIHVTRVMQTDGVTWYFDAWLVTSDKPSCWVYGPATIAGDGTNRQFLELPVLDHVLARTNVALDGYVEVENFLSGDPAWRAPSGRVQISELVGFRYLQMLDRALDVIRAEPDLPIAKIR